MFLKRVVMENGLPFPTFFGSDLKTKSEKLLNNIKDNSLPLTEADIETYLYLIDRQIENEESTRKALEALRKCQDESKKNGNSEMTLDQINEIIRQVREERRKKNG